MVDSTAGSADSTVKVKLVFLGESAVGKSAAALRFVNNQFSRTHKGPTIGAAFYSQKCRLDHCVLRYEIWVTAGQERFQSLAPMYYRNAQAAVVVYDITNASSFERAKARVTELRRQANPNIVIALVGNKVDLVQHSPSSTGVHPCFEANDATAPPREAPSSEAEPETLRQISRADAQAYAAETGLLFFETSAKTGENIIELFTEIGKKIPIEHTLAASNDGGSSVSGSRV
ncbi:hypothetical protein APHAL10511_007701 [Amanita phalloides]|nr:hypothetical protein APHAL10511_007701 [Amanita phalloides]